VWQHLESEARNLFRLFGFKEIRPPLLERTDLFSRSIGQDTDIVTKEMYTITDSKGRGLTLRPEATASVARAYIQHRLYQDDPIQKLFTIGPMFRHERPQKGRFRQFHQINAELFGDPGPRSDADIIHMALHLFTTVGLKGPVLYINSLGCSQCRGAFRQELKGFLAQKTDVLCADCRTRAHTNPLRVFDCKVDACKQAIADAPSILDHICDDCREHFTLLQGYLQGLDIPFSLNHRLVRGLDYYTRTAFEIQSDRLGAQNAVIGGGRYDGLLKQLGGPDHPAIGFAIGVERLLTLLDDTSRDAQDGPILFIAGLGGDAQERAFYWTNALRRSGIWTELEYGSKGLKAQMKKADRLGAKKVFIVGDDEIASGQGILRDMETKEQINVNLDTFEEDIKALL
jgi:histidyl-tRNA synthetase